MDGLTVVETKYLIPKERIIDKTLDQMTLSERANVLKEAYNFIDSEEEATEEEMDIIGRIEAKLEDKIASWGLVIKKFEEAAEVCMVEADYYKKKYDEAKARADGYKNKSENMMEYVRLKMIEFNIKKVGSPSLTISLRKKPQSVIITDEADIDKPERPEFVHESTSRRWDKGAIKAALSEGVLFKSVKLSEPDFSISIKKK